MLYKMRGANDHLRQFLCQVACSLLEALKRCQNLHLRVQMFVSLELQWNEFVSSLADQIARLLLLSSRHLSQLQLLATKTQQLFESHNHGNYGASITAACSCILEEGIS